MDHSTIVYLMGPDGAYVAHFTAGVDSVAMAKRLESLVK